MATKVRKLVIELELDDGSFSTKMISAEGKVEKFGSAADKASGKIDKMGTATKRMGSIVRDSVIVLGLAQSAFHNLNAALTGPIRGVARISAEFERMRVLLGGLTGEIGEVAKSIANTNFEYLVDTSRQAPFSINALTDSFVKMRSVGIDPTKRAMSGLTNAIAAFGGGDEVLKRASVAIQQMAGKGVISMEELRQQLGEAVPSAIKLMARSMGLTYKELVDLISKGRVTATNALENMFDEFERTFGGKSQDLMDTFTGSMSRLNTEFLLFVDQQIALGGSDNKGATLFGDMKLAIEDLMAAFRDPAVQEFGVSIGKAMQDGIAFLRQSIEFVIRFKSEIFQMGTVLLAVFAGRKILSAVAILKTEMVGAAVTAHAGFSRLSTMMIGLKGGIGGVTGQTTKLTSVMWLAGTAVRGVGRAFSLMFGPLGLFVTLVYELAQALDFFGDKAEEAFEKARNGEFLSKEELKAAQKEVKALEDQVKKFNDEITRLESYEASGGKFGQKAIKGLEKRRDEVQALLNEVQKNITVEADRQTEEQAKRASRKRLKVLSEETKEIQQAFKKQQDEDDVLRAESGTVETKQRKEFEEKVLASRKNYANEMINVLLKQIEKEKEIVADGEEKIAGTAKLTLQGLHQQLKKFTSLRDSAASGKVELLPGSNSGNKKNRLDSEMERLLKVVARAQGPLEGLGKELSVIQALIKQGVFKDKAPEEIAALEALAEKADKVTAAWKRNRKEANSTKRGLKGLTDALAQAAVKAKEAAEAFAGKANDSTAIQNFERRIRKMVDLVKAGTTERVQAEKDASEAIKNFRRAETLTTVTEIRKQTAELNRSLLGKKARIEEELNAEIDRMERSLDLDSLEKEERSKAEALLQNHIKALRARADRDQESAIDSMLRKWKDTTTQMQDAGARWIDDFSNRLTDSLVDGKANFKDFAVSILKDILRIQIQANITNLGSGLISGLFNSITSGLFGGSSTSVVLPPDDGFRPIPNAKGNAFSNGLVNAFASGGVVDSPTMFNYGRSGLGLMGEAGPESIMPLKRMRNGDLGVQSISGAAPMVQVNIINQTGKDVEAKQRGARFDGKKMVLDVVLTEAGQPGPFRDGMREAMR